MSRARRPIRPIRPLVAAFIVGAMLASLAPAVALASDPIAVDDSFTVPVDASTTSLDVLANDSDPDVGDTLTITDVTVPANGTATVNGDAIDYQPDAAFHGIDTFDYTIEDSTAGSSTATVTVIVNSPPVAADDHLETSQDAPPTAVDVLANDTDVDGDSLTITDATDGATGTVVITGGGTGLTYQPDPGVSVDDSFTYTISDGNGGSATGTVTVTIVPNVAPNAANDAGLTVPESAGPTGLDVLANDTDADGDTLTITGKTSGAHGTVAITGGGTGLTYDPVQLFHGTDAFTYTISDGHGGTDTATVLVTVQKDVVAPIVVAPVATIPGQTEGSSTTKVHLSWSATDPGGTGITGYKVQVQAAGGAWSTIHLARATSTSIDQTLRNGRTYRFRVRSTDREGNVSTYTYGPTFKVTRYQDSSAAVHRSGSWTTKKDARALGTHAYSASTSARVALTASMREVAWVATKTAHSGRAQVWIDGTLAGTIDLHAASSHFRKVVFRHHFASLATHTIELRPIGGGRIDLDAFLVLR